MQAIDVLIDKYSYCSRTDKGTLFSSMFCDSEIDTHIRNCNTHIRQYTHKCNIHITLDAGAAFRFYQVIWNNKNEFKSLLIHLIDLFGFTEFFEMVQNHVNVSGSEDNKFQAELCTTGSLKGILSGKH